LACVTRVSRVWENLLLNVRDFKVFRRKEGDEEGPLEYLRLRKGVADLHRRAELGRKINERYAEALATVEDKNSLAELTQDLGRPTTWKVNGFRNRDLRALLFAKTRRPQRLKKSNDNRARSRACCACCAPTA
jgi:hypothetical protein